MKTNVVARIWFRNGKMCDFDMNRYVNGATAGIFRGVKLITQKWDEIAQVQLFNNFIEVGDKIVFEAICVGSENPKRIPLDVKPIVFKNRLQEWLGQEITFGDVAAQNVALDMQKQNYNASMNLDSLVFKHPNQIYYHCKKLLAQQEAAGAVEHFARKAMEKYFHALGETGIQTLIQSLKK